MSAQSALAALVAQRADFWTCQVAAWTDGFPLIGQAAQGAVSTGVNAGSGSLAVVSVAAGARRGAYLCTVTAVQAGLALYSVTDPDGDAVATGVSGSPVDAGGVRLTLTQGSTPFAVGDAFGVSVLTGPLDVSGLRFRLDARLNARSATRTFQGDSAPDDGGMPSLILDPTRGALANHQLVPAMARQPPGDYPYTVTAFDPLLDPTGAAAVIAFYGEIRHRAVLAPSSSIPSP